MKDETASGEMESKQDGGKKKKSVFSEVKCENGRTLRAFLRTSR